MNPAKQGNATEASAAVSVARLALGTAQFGLDYGINNRRGQIPPMEVNKILQTAHQAGITTLDTAAAYGDSEAVIGDHVHNSGETFQIISKISAVDVSAAESIFQQSLARLRQPKLYGSLIHNFENFQKNPDLWKFLEKEKAEGRVEKIGFSLYRPEELDFLLKNGIAIDLVQIPYSVFDRRFDDRMTMLAEKGIEIHARSVFLQGLAFKNPDELDPHFHAFRSKLEALHAFTKNEAVSPARVCLGFVLGNPSVGKVVVGIDGLTHLKETIDNARNGGAWASWRGKINHLREDDESIVLPYNWKR